MDNTPAASLEGVSPTLTYYAGRAPLSGAPSAAGTYTVVATFPGGADYTMATATATINVLQATPTVVVSPVSTTYDGQGHGTTGTVTGIGGVVLGPATISYNTGDGNAPVNAGSYVATGSFAGNGNYASATGTADCHRRGLYHDHS